MSKTTTMELNETLPRTPKVNDLLAKVQVLLEDGKYPQVMELIARSKVDSPWVTHALGVCHLRLGNAAKAVEIFRGLVLRSGGLVLREDVPIVFKTNYATALFLSGNPDGGVSVLRELGEKSGEAGLKLFQALDQWIQELSLWQKLTWYLGGRPSRPIVLGFPAGDLE
jgi:hypothetical protein